MGLDPRWLDIIAKADPDCIKAGPAVAVAPAGGGAKAADVGICIDCNAGFLRKDVRKKLCDSCVELHRKATVKKYAAKRSTPPGNTERARRRIEEMAFHGAAASVEAALSDDWTHRELVFSRYYRFSTPFSSLWSKNALYTHIRKKGKRCVVIKKEIRDMRDAFSESIRIGVSSNPFVQGKVWIDLLVQKPTNHSDAINVIDSISDAIKKGIGVDDRWFCIGRVDWQIVKSGGKIIVGIGQEGSEPCQVCSFCGFVLPFSQFTKNRSTLSGMARSCNACRAKCGWK